jgi:hypothetical protein
MSRGRPVSGSGRVTLNDGAAASSSRAPRSASAARTALRPDSAGAGQGGTGTGAGADRRAGLGLSGVPHEKGGTQPVRQRRSAPVAGPVSADSSPRATHSAQMMNPDSAIITTDQTG